MIKRVPVKTIAVTGTLLASLAAFEGFREESYKDSAGVDTIGFGTTEGVRPGDRIDPVRAVIQLAADAEKHAQGVRDCIGDTPVYPWEAQAFYSLAYNIGTGNFCRSTLLRKLKAGDYAGACKEILRWKYAGGKVLPGLVRRRLSEFETCIGADNG